MSLINKAVNCICNQQWNCDNVEIIERNRVVFLGFFLRFAQLMLVLEDDMVG